MSKDHSAQEFKDRLKLLIAQSESLDNALRIGMLLGCAVELAEKDGRSADDLIKVLKRRQAQVGN